MASANKLSHNPDIGGHVAYLCGFSGLQWRGLAENVGVGYSEVSVWNAFIASPAHRANIDNPAWDSMGFGVYKRSDSAVRASRRDSSLSACCPRLTTWKITKVCFPHTPSISTRSIAS